MNRRPSRWLSIVILLTLLAGLIPAPTYASSNQRVLAADLTAPTSPTSVRLSTTTPNRTETSIRIAWNASTDNVGVTGYQVYSNNNTGYVGTTTGLEMLVSGLTPNTAYAFTVRALDAASNVSVPSSAFNVSTLPPDTTAPSVPGSLRLASTTPNRTETTVALAWNASTDSVGVTGYEVFRNGALLTTVTGLAYTATGLAPNTSYSFTVKAKDAAGNRSAASTALSATTLADTTAPSAPGSLRLSSTTPNPTASTVALTWNASTDNFGVTGYEVYRNGGLVGTTTGTSYTASGNPSITYSFTVKAKDAAGNRSAASNALSVTMLDDTTPPSAPSNLGMKSNTDNSISIAWGASTDNVGVAGYDVYKNGALLATITGRDYTASGLTPSTSYSFMVQARDTVGNLSPASAVLNASTTADVTPPSAPSPPTDVEVSMTSITISWGASADNVGVTGYEVYSDGMLVGTTATTRFTHTGLCTYCEYYYTVAAFDAAGNLSAPSSPEVRIVTAWADSTPPGAPYNLAVTDKDAQSVSLQWTAPYDAEGVTSYDIYRGGVLAGSSATPNYTVTGLHALTSYSFTVKARDAAGNVSSASAALSVTTLADTTPPTAPTALTSPSKNEHNVSLQWTASTDYEGVTGYDIYRDGVLAGTTATTSYVATGLQGGTAYSFTVKARDAAGNVSAASPALSVTTDVALLADFQFATVAGTPRKIQFTDLSTTPPTGTTWAWTFDDGETSTSQSPAHTYLVAGTYQVVLTVSNGADSASVTKSVTVEHGEPLPPSPVTVAPPVNQTTGSDIASAVEFLYSSPDPIQTGVAPGTIKAPRVAVIRGQITTAEDRPIAGVTVSIQDHPELGQTKSRSDGMYDLAVNGGGDLMVQYQRSGFLDVQQQVATPWRDYVWAAPVVMTPKAPDAESKLITLGSSSQQDFASRVVADADGARQSVLVFPPNLSAIFRLPDGSTQPAPSTVRVRATEYTVGDSGPEAMPGDLPFSSGYTYATEFSLDEADALDAEVEFSQPVINYTDNFIGFPVGSVVPTGSYDEDKGAWVPSGNGRVVAIISITNGRANIDTDGDGDSDATDATVLAISDSERDFLGSKYAAGRQLWRVPLPHFSPWDHNWPYGPPADATGPNGGPPVQDPGVDNPCPRDGSIIGCENQSLGETFSIPGTPFQLSYSSNQAALRKQKLRIPLSAATVPQSLQSIELEIEVAGRIEKRSFTPTPGTAQSFVFAWDGKDAYGREIQGDQPVRVRTGFSYPAVYNNPAPDGNAFGTFGGEPINIVGDRAESKITMWQGWSGTIGAMDTVDQGIGGWTLDVHHVYDVAGKTLRMGNSQQRQASVLPNTISQFAGGEGRTNTADNIAPDQALLNQIGGVTVGPDGAVYVASNTYSSGFYPDYSRIRKIAPNASNQLVVTTYAGTASNSGLGDNGPATGATFYNIKDIDFGPDGSMYVAERGVGASGQRIRRISPQGIVTTVAGTGTQATNSGNPIGDGQPATSVPLYGPLGVAVAGDGTVYFSDVYGGSGHLRRVGTDGIITTVALYTKLKCLPESPQTWINDVEIAPDGNVYILSESTISSSNVSYSCVFQLNAAGALTKVVGASTVATKKFTDGAAATAVNIIKGNSLAFADDGTLYIATNYRLVKVSPDGIVTTAAGNGNGGITAESGPATGLPLLAQGGLAAASDGSIYVANAYLGLRKIGAPMPGYTGSDIAIPSEDGSEIYQFSASGRHLRTRNALTNDVIYSFNYDSAGRLIGVVDRDNRTTVIERDTTGKVTGIVSPDGVRTALVIGAGGFLSSITNAEQETTSFTYSAEGDGLLTSMTDPRQKVHTYEYWPDGRLKKDSNPVGGYTELVRELVTPGISVTGTNLDGTAATFTVRDGFRVTATNALGDAAIYEVLNLTNGDVQRITTAPNTAVTKTEIKPDGTRIILDPKGLRTTITMAPDPRWGMQVPFMKSMTIKAANGTTVSTMSTDRVVVLANPGDPFSNLVRLTETQTLNGLTSTTVYEASTRTQTETDPAGRASAITYDSKSRQERVAVTGFEPIVSTFNAKGQLTQRTLGSGSTQRVTSMTYFDNGFLKTVTDPLNHTTSYTYDAVGRMLTQTLPTNHTQSWTYDDAGNQTSSVDAVGVKTTFEYDDQNRLTARVSDANGRAVRTEYQFDTADNLLKQIDDAGAGRINATTTLTYEPVGITEYAVKTVTNPLNEVTTKTYTIFGEVKTVTDALNHTTTMGYDSQGRVTTVTSPGGRVVTTTYNVDGKPLTITDPRGSVTVNTYDANRRLSTTTANTVAVDGFPATNQTTTYGYDVNSRVTSITDPLNKVTTFTFDTFGNQTRVTDALGNITTTTYDALDRVVEVVSGANNTDEDLRTIYTYDAIGRLLTERVDPDGKNLLTQYLYEQLGDNDTWHLRGVVDPNNRTTRYHYNSLGLRDQTIDALSKTWQFTYDNLGRLTAQTDPLSHGTAMGYDGLGRMTSLTEAGRTESWSYRADGLMNTHTDFASRVTTYGYDIDGRLTGIDYPNGTADVTYGYDAASNPTSVIDGLGTTSYRYDGLNQLRERTRDGRTVTYGYDGRSALTSLDYWGHGTVAYGYDDAGRLTSLNPWSAGATTYTYRSTGLAKTQVRANGVQTTYGYDGASRLNGIAHTKGATSVQLFQYALDNAGNRTAMLDGDGTTTYAYDDVNRLTSVLYPAIAGGPAEEQVDYTMDPVGNRLTPTLPGGGSTYAYDAANRITNSGFQYDDNGNLLSGDNATYAYDAANRLTSSTRAGVTTTYFYDGWGNLIRQASGGVTTDFVLDESSSLPRILGEIRSDGSELRYAYGPGGVSAQQVHGQAVEYPLLDALGSVRGLTNSAGALTLRRSYDAFGAIRFSSGAGATTLAFSGERFNPADGTLYLRARHYLTTLGRFLERDSFAGDSGRPQSLNRYAYAENNPATWTDPSGQCIGWIWGSETCTNGYAETGELNIEDGLEYWRGIRDSALEPFKQLVEIPYKTLTDPEYRRQIGRGWNRFWDDIPGSLSEVAKGALSPFKDLYDGFRCDDMTLLSRGLAGTSMAIAGAGDTYQGAKNWYNKRFRPQSLKGGALAEGEAAALAEGNAAKSAARTCLNSFTPDTPVSTDRGLLPIGWLKVGMTVLAYDEETQTTGLFSITDVLVHEDPLMIDLTIDGEQITTTPEHPFFTHERGWVDAGDLRVGEHVPSANGGSGEVEQVLVRNETRTMYNLTVDTAHTFFVGEGEWLVHNITCGGPYKDVTSRPGYEKHHMPANSVSPLSHGKGPSISMEIADHYQTASWGSSKAAQAYRATQERLIQQGLFDDAILMDITDIQSKFGSKYDAAILEMIGSLP